MSNSSPTFTKALNGGVKWTGKATLGFLVLSLILLAATLSLADPNVKNFNGTGQFETMQKLSISDSHEVQVFFGADNDIATLHLEKIDFNPTLQKDEYTIILNLTSDIGYNSVFLQAGDYRFQVSAPVGTNVWLVNAHFNIGLVIVTAVFFSIFSIFASIFFTLLPFWVFFLILSSMSSSNKEQQLPMQTYTEPKRRREEEVVYQQTPQVTPTQATFTTPNTKVNTNVSTISSRMTRGEKIWGITAIVFFFAFFAAPDSPLFFFAVIIVAIIAWNVSEREKMKGHIASILQLYPNTSVSFMTQQLSKKEDKVIKVVRMMILDYGYPIKLDLVNNTIHKVGKFPEEFTQSSGPGSTFATAIPDDAPESTPTPHRPTSSLAQAPGPVARTESQSVQSAPEPQPEPTPQVVEEDLPTKTTEGATGQIREPMLYCSACGAPLKAEVKYCYICGARQ